MALLPSKARHESFVVYMADERYRLPPHPSPLSHQYHTGLPHDVGTRYAHAVGI